MSRSLLDRQLTYLDYLLEAACATVEVAYNLDFNEPTKEEAFRRLDQLLTARDRWRRLWANADLRRPEETPVYNPEDLVA